MHSSLIHFLFFTVIPFDVFYDVRTSYVFFCSVINKKIFKKNNCRQIYLAAVMKELSESISQTECQSGIPIVIITI